MNSINLSQYLTSESFLNEIRQKNLNFDEILIDNLDIKWKKSLIILNQLNIENLTNIRDKIPKWSKIINLNIWIWSIWRKLKVEIDDLDKILDKKIWIYEPFDLNTLFQQLESDEIAYLRIPYQDMPKNIFAVNEDDIAVVDSQILQKIDFLNLQWYGFKWDNWTILASWSNFSTVLQIWDTLNENWLPMDIFVINKLNWTLNPDFFSSLKKTKKLITIIDALPSYSRENLLRTLAKDNWVNNFELKWLHPQYDKITTILDEYQKEQAEFDAENLFNKLK